MKVAVLFPGQGSQFLGMGQEFMETYPECRQIMDIAEDVCKVPLAKICNEGPMEDLTRAINLQPAITAVNLMCWEVMQSKLSGKLDVSFVAGHSLGEYSALYASGATSLEDTIKLVARRGALMEREGQTNPGGMRAVIGLTIDEVERIIVDSQNAGIATVANYNTETQIVISGDLAGLDAVNEKVDEAGGRVVPLNVSVANHSPLVANAVPDFAEFMKSIPFSKPEIPLIFNVTAQEEENIDQIKEIMASQIASRVRWYETINLMLKNGVDTFIEVGPKTVLKGMMRKIVPKGTPCTTMQFDSPAGLEKCIEKLI